MGTENGPQSTFERIAGDYLGHARVASEVADRLLERLDGLRFAPRTIVDLGCGPGVQARALADRFRPARVVALDRARAMLGQAEARRGRWRRRFERVAADARALPLADASVELLFSNLMLPWCDDVPALLNAFRRVLKPGGMMLVSTLGPDTLIELRRCLETVGRPKTAGPAFSDVQTIGDAMLRAGFAEPVLDTDWITTTYHDPRDLLAELAGSGVTPVDGAETQQRDAVARAYESCRLESGLYPATWEVVYASAWAPEEGAPIRTFHGEEATVSVASIGRRQR